MTEEQAKELRAEIEAMRAELRKLRDALVTIETRVYRPTRYK